MSNKLIKSDDVMAISPSKISNVSSLKASPLSALEAFNILVKEYSNYKQVVETERTKRQAIKAWSQARAEETKLKKDFLKQYLVNSFSERRYVIDEMFKRLDEGIESGNNQLITMAMTSISDIVKSSPLQEAEKVMLAMSDPEIKKIEF